MRTVFPRRQVMPSPAHDGDTDRSLQGAIVAGIAADRAGDASRLFAFQHGKDTQPRPMSDDEIRQLGDVFTQQVLLAGPVIPVTLGGLTKAIEVVFCQTLPVRKMFLVDEGAMPHQLNSDFALNTRLVFTWQVSSGTPRAAAGDTHHDGRAFGRGHDRQAVLPQAWP